MVVHDGKLHVGAFGDTIEGKFYQAEVVAFEQSAKDEADLLDRSAELTYYTKLRVGSAISGEPRLYAAGAASGDGAGVRQDLARRAVVEFAQGTQQLQPILRAILATLGNPRLVAGFDD